MNKLTHPLPLNKPISLVPVTLLTSLLFFGYVVLSFFVFHYAHALEAAQREEVFFFALTGVHVLAGFVYGFFTHRLRFRTVILAVLLAHLMAILIGFFGYEWHLLKTPEVAAQLSAQEGTLLTPGEWFMGPMWLRTSLSFGLFFTLQCVVFYSLAFILQEPGRYSQFKQLLSRDGFSSFVAIRYLYTEGRGVRISKTALIASLGVSLGVAALIAVMSAMSGYQAEVKDKLLMTNAHVVIQKLGREFEDYDSIRDRIDDMPHVLAAAPFIFTGGMLASSSGMYPVLVKGIDPELAPRVSGISEQLRAVKIDVLHMPVPGHLPHIILGHELVIQLGLKIGDEVALVSPVPAEGKRGGPPRRMPFKLAGEFVSGMNEFDQKLVYVGIEAGQRFMGDDQSVTGIEIKVDDAEHARKLAEQVVQNLGGWPFHAIDWMQMNQGIFSALKMQKMLMFFILLFMIVVAAFNVASTLLMVVVEKTKEIAIFKAMGAPDSVIMRIFVLQGHLIAGVGVVIGVCLGLLLCFIMGHLKIHIAADVYLIDTVRVVVRPLEVLAIACGAVEIAHLATLYPALTASEKLPVDAIRYG